MTRKVDMLGRIVLPAEVRERLGIRPEDELEVDMEEEPGIIRLKKAGKTCLRCGSTEKLMDIVAGYSLCDTCLKEMVAGCRETANSVGSKK